MTEEQLINRLQGLQCDSNTFHEVFLFLQASERKALALIAHLKDPSGPPVLITSGGNIEAGLFLFWIHCPPKPVQDWLDKHEVLKHLFHILQKEAPRTQITTADYDVILAKVESNGFTSEDGTLYGTKTYEQLDPNWLLVPINYAANLLDPSLVHAPLPVAANTPTPLTPKSSGDPTLAIIGDWGTGFFTEDGVKCPAERLTADLEARRFDYLVHLGDVYYAGTDWRPLPGEEQSNFVDVWPDQGKDRNLTLNSNHEMYGGAQGYFDVALASHLFTSQAGASFFARTYEPWLVLGLDSAYYSDAQNGDKMYMDGAIGSATDTAQIDWLAQFRGYPGPIMVMTHHNPCDTLTGVINVLFEQVHSALGKTPDVWYWGHVHNGIVYEQLFHENAQSAVPTKGRCCGHASIPFGNGWGLADQANIPYYAHTKDPAYPEGNLRVLNGYATVQLHRNGSFTESFYEVGIEQPCWHRTWPR